MEPDNKQNHERIDNLRKSLYSRQGPPKLRKYIDLHPKQYGVAESWADEGASPTEEKLPPKSSIFKKILIAAVIFFVGTLLVAGYITFQGNNVISSNNIAITILGQTSANAGEPLSLDVNIANRNSVDLQLVDLVVQYPAGTKTADGTSQDLPRSIISLGTIKAGETVQKSINAILYGQQGDIQNISLSVEYRLAGSNAVYHADKTYQLTISSSPVSLAIDSLKEINSGQEITLNAHLTSNSPNVISNLLLKTDYPFGFQFESATPTPFSSSNNTWNIGDLEHGGSRDFSITGKIVGQDNDQRVFRFYTGTQDASSSSNISTIFINTTQAVVIQKPFLEML